jgi:hypothetical protein
MESVHEPEPDLQRGQKQEIRDQDKGGDLEDPHGRNPKEFPSFEQPEGRSRPRRQIFPIARRRGSW